MSFLGGTNSMNTVLALDQGSSSTKAILFGGDKIIWQGQLPVQTSEFEDGRVEQNPEELLSSILSLWDQARQYSAKNKIKIQSVAFSCQRSGVLAWDASGKALHPLITWRDRRTSSRIDQIRPNFEFLTAQTSLPVLPDYSGSKIAYLQELFTNPRVMVGTLDSFLIYNLSAAKAFVTDHSMAARSLLYNLADGKWDQQQCHILGVAIDRLPKITASVNTGISVRDLPLNALIGDGQAALLSVLPANQAVLNMGTISSVSLYTGTRLKRLNGFISSICYVSDHARHFMLEAITNASGDVFRYLERELQIQDLNTQLAHLELPSTMPQQLAYLPIRGTATPDWCYGLPNVFQPELSKLTKQETLLAGSLSVANFIARNINIAIEANMLERNTTLIATGGVARYQFLLAFVSKVTGLLITQAENFAGSVLGVARLAGGLDNNSSSTVLGTEVAPGPNWCGDYHEQWLQLEQKLRSNE